MDWYRTRSGECFACLGVGGTSVGVRANESDRGNGVIHRSLNHETLIGGD